MHPLHHERLPAGGRADDVPVLALGGIHLDHAYLRPWLDPLAEARTLLYMDWRGTGRSRPGASGAGDAPPLPDGELSHARWADDVVALADHLGRERMILLGHSYGGFLALEAALRHPDRTAGLVLCATAASAGHMSEAANALAGRATSEQREALGRLLAGPVTDAEELREGWLEILPIYFHEPREAYLEPFRERVRYSAEAYNRAFFEALPAYDVTDRLPEVEVPALVLSGRHDWIMPPGAAGEPLARGLPRAEHRVFEESGHFPFMEERERFVAVVTGWLEEGPEQGP